MSNKLKEDIEMPIKLAKLYDLHKAKRLQRKAGSSMNNFWKKRNLTAFCKLWDFLKEKNYNPDLYMEAQFSGEIVPYINSLYSERAEKRFLWYKNMRERRLHISQAEEIKPLYESIRKDMVISCEILSKELGEDSEDLDAMRVFLSCKEKLNPYLCYKVSIYKESYEDDLLTLPEKKKYKAVEEALKNKHLDKFIEDVINWLKEECPFLKYLIKE